LSTDPNKSTSANGFFCKAYGCCAHIIIDTWNGISRDELVQWNPFFDIPAWAGKQRATTNNQNDELKQESDQLELLSVPSASDMFHGIQCEKLSMPCSIFYVRKSLLLALLISQACPKLNHHCLLSLLMMQLRKFAWPKMPGTLVILKRYVMLAQWHAHLCKHRLLIVPLVPGEDGLHEGYGMAQSFAVL
jgi:hypothetical protein